MSADGAAEPLPALLARGGAPASLAEPVRRHLGADAAALLAADPWLLLGVPTSHAGEAVRPEQADAFARALLGAQARPGDPRRAGALVGWLLERAARDGHTVLPLPEVLAVLEHFGCAGEEALPDVLASGGVLALAAAHPPEDDGDGTDQPEADDASADERLDPARHVLALDRFAMAEESVAESVARLTATAPPWPADLTLAQEGVLVSLDAGLARSGVVAVTGAATGGLDETLDALVEALGAAGVDVARIDAAASPLPDDRIADDPIADDRIADDRIAGVREGGVLVVADADALGLEAAAALLERVEDGVRVVLAGDTALLPPRAPGQVLADLASGGSVPAVRAPSTAGAPGRGGPSREPVGPGGPPHADGALARLAAGLRAGTLPAVDAPGREVVVVAARDAADVGRRVVQLVGDSIPRALGIPAEDVAVLTPLRGGEAGAERLGALLAGAGGAAAARTMTVHQAGRGRWPAVVLALPGEAAGVLDRAMLLTAVTRGARHVSIVHAAGDAVAVAAARLPRRGRRTRLALAVREALAEL